MTTVTCANKSSPALTLHGKWDIYYHLPNDSNWNLLSYKHIMKDIDSVDAVKALNSNMDE